MSVLAEIGREVRRERHEHGLTQEALALRAGISRAYLSDVERGKRDLSVTVLFKILAAFGAPAGCRIRRRARPRTAASAAQDRANWYSALSPLPV